MGGLSLLDSYQGSLGMNAISRLKGVKGSPHNEMEFEWLEAFLWCMPISETIGKWRLNMILPTTGAKKYVGEESVVLLTRSH